MLKLVEGGNIKFTIKLLLINRSSFGFMSVAQAHISYHPIFYLEKFKVVAYTHSLHFLFSHPLFSPLQSGFLLHHPPRAPHPRNSSQSSYVPSRAYASPTSESSLAQSSTPHVLQKPLQRHLQNTLLSPGPPPA